MRARCIPFLAALLLAAPAGARSIVKDGANTVISGPASEKRLRKNRKRRHKRRRRYRRRRLKLVQLTSGPGLRVNNPKRAWGTPLMVDRLREVLLAYNLEFPDAPKVGIHDLSRRYGGRIHPHVSHRTGRDVDIRLVFKKPPRRKGLVRGRPSTIHKERMWFLVKTLVDTCDVEFIFLDKRLKWTLYRFAKKQGMPLLELRSLFRGFILHWPGHDDHMHVRFKKRTFPTLMAKCYCKNRKQATMGLSKNQEALRTCLNLPPRPTPRKATKPKAPRSVAMR